jgi:hypothetical protein
LGARRLPHANSVSRDARAGVCPRAGASVARHSPPRGVHAASLDFCDARARRPGCCSRCASRRRRSRHRRGSHRLLAAAVAGYPPTTYSAITRQWNFRGVPHRHHRRRPRRLGSRPDVLHAGRDLPRQRATDSGWGSWMDLAFTDVDPRLRRGPIYRDAYTPPSPSRFAREHRWVRGGQALHLLDQMGEGPHSPRRPERPWHAGQLNIHELIAMGWADPDDGGAAVVAPRGELRGGRPVGPVHGLDRRVPFTTVPEPHAYALLSAGLAGSP